MMTPDEIRAKVDAMRESLTTADDALPRAERMGWKQSLYPNTLEGFDGQADYELSLQDDGRWACSASEPTYMPGWMTGFLRSTDPAEGADVPAMVAHVQKLVREEWRRQHEAAHPMGR